MRVRSLLFLPIAALVLAACSGGDGSSAEAKPYVDAMVQSMTEGEDAMPEDDARCFSEKFVDVVGMDRVKAAGEPEDFGSDAGSLDFDELELTRDEAGDMYDALVDCGQDPKEQVLDGLEDDNVSAEAKACVEDLVTDDLMREAMIAGILGEEDNEKALELSSGMMQCVMGDMEVGGSGSDLDLGDDVDLGELDIDDLDLDAPEN